MENSKKKGSWRRGILIALCVILSLILVLLIFAAVFMDRLLGSINRVPNEQTLSSSDIEELLKPVETRDQNYSGPVVDASDVTLPSEDAEIIENDHVVNILLLGQDRRGGTRNSLTDVMMLCTINKETKTLTMTSFLRDLYLKIPGHYRSDKLNVAYPVGGFKMIDAALEVNFGVKVDGNVEVDFSQFARIIDLLGGVDVELTGAEAAYMNARGFSVRSGMNHLDGDAALRYSRIRSIDSDFYRTNRQRNVVTAIVKQFKNASLGQITDTLVGVLGMITTDMSDAEIMSYALELAPLLKDLKIQSQHIPAEGTYYYGDVKDQNIVDCIFISDFETNRKLIEKAFED